MSEELTHAKLQITNEYIQNSPWQLVIQQMQTKNHSEIPLCFYWSHWGEKLININVFKLEFPVLKRTQKKLPHLSIHSRLLYKLLQLFQKTIKKIST